MTKPILISGIQPSGRLHLGNYLGILQKFVTLQNEKDEQGDQKYECFFFIADLHSLTEDFDPQKKKQQIEDAVADSLNFGVNHDTTTVFVQSAVPAHSELAWILNTITPMGELSRMTQFKEKSEFAKKNVNIGLFDYPILMAADILLYDAKFVPVGKDQFQHLELTRTIANKFNKKFGKTFETPRALFSDSSLVMSLDDPTKKMSKSRPSGCLFLNDTHKEIKDKIARAKTDSGKEIRYDKGEKPGLSNLIDLYAGLSQTTPQSVVQEHSNESYSEFKNIVSDKVIEVFDYLKEHQEKQKQGIKERDIIKDGNGKANEVANKKLEEVKKKIGLL